MDKQESQPAVKKPRFGSGYELWIILAMGFLAADAIREIVTTFTSSGMTVPLSFDSDSEAKVEIAGQLLPATGKTELTLSTGILAADTIALLLIAQFIVVLMVIGAGFCIVPLVRGIAEGEPFGDRAARSLSILLWVFVVGFILNRFTTVLGINCVSRDLDIADMTDSGNDASQSFMLLGVAGAILLLQQAFRSGRKAQEELEGLV